MLIFDHISCVKLVHDCRISSFMSYIVELSGSEKKVLMPLTFYDRAIFTIRYLKHYFFSNKISFQFNLFEHKTGKRLKSTAYFERIPYIIISMDISLDANPDYDNINKLIKSGVFDIITVVHSDVGKYMIIGKTEWIYLREKISRLNKNNFANKCYATNYNIYNVLSQFKVISTVLNPISEIELLYFSSHIPNHLKATLSNDNVRKFLTSCDKVLLTIWGEKEFANKLSLIGVSLDEWLKIV